MPEDVTSLDAMLNAAGTAPATPPPAAPEPPASPTPAETPPTPAPSPAPTDPTPTSTPAQPVDKSAQAFAQMRIQNAQYEKALKQAAVVAGLDVGTPLDKIPELLQAKMLEKQATTQNVPLELLQQMEGFKAKAEAFEKAQMEQAAFASFNQVRTMHGLTEQDMIEFANQLDQKGINPFQTSGIDLVKEYRNLYFDSILQKSVDAAVQKALGTQQAAADHSTKPGTKSGPAGDTSKQGATSVQSLDDLLNAATPR